VEAETIAFVRGQLRAGGCSSDEFHAESLPGDGSKRQFWRIKSPCLERPFIVMLNPPVTDTKRRENFAYLQIGEHLYRKGIPVPVIYGYELSNGHFALQDLGSRSLQEVASSSGPLPVYEQVLEELVKLQIEGAREFETRWCFQTQTYDRNVMLRDEAGYFQEAFLNRYLGMGTNRTRLHAPFSYLAEMASRPEGTFLLHRDFQSRNILVSTRKIGIIDWQGARKGPLGYDLASLLFDPYVDLPPRQAEDLLQQYLSILGGYNPRWTGPVKQYFLYLAVQRNLQILGAFSHLVLEGRKRYFEAYIPVALRTLRELLDRINDRRLFELKSLVSDVELPRKGVEGTD